MPNFKSVTLASSSINSDIHIEETIGGGEKQDNNYGTNKQTEGIKL